MSARDGAAPKQKQEKAPVPAPAHGAAFPVTLVTQGMTAAGNLAQSMSRSCSTLARQKLEMAMKAQAEMSDLISKSLGPNDPLAMMVLPQRCAELMMRFWMEQAEHSTRTVSGMFGQSRTDGAAPEGAPAEKPHASE